jgi:ABC-type spermidine/putrescine transport system permease subunit I
MVIAIFMSYIGFSGIITEQLKQIEVITQTMEILTTNKSSLMAGFYFFTAFALLSLLISHKLQYGVTEKK